MLDIIVATNDDRVLFDNLMRSPLLALPGVSLHLQRGFASAARAFNDALPRCKSEIVVFAHQDVYIPHQWPEQLFESIAVLERADPLWSVLGVYGVTQVGTHVGYVWSSGLNKLLGEPFNEPRRVASIDELLIVLRRSAGIQFDDALPGFHLYGTDIVQTSLSLGRTAYVIFAPVIHNSRPVLYLAKDYIRAYECTVSKWHARLPIPTCVAPLVSSRAVYWKLVVRQLVGRARYACTDRATLDRGLDCIEIAHNLGLQ